MIGRMTQAAAIGAAIAVIALAAATPKVAGRNQFTLPATGRFRGYAEVFVSWTAQRTLVVDVTLADDGTVTGCIGDAALLKGRIEPGRGAIARRLGWKRDWLVTGDLDGAIIARDSIVRSGLSMPLDWTGDRYTGGLTTTGAEFGGRDRMKLAAGKLALMVVPPTASVGHSLTIVPRLC